MSGVSVFYTSMQKFNSERRTKENVVPLLDEVGHLTKMDKDKMEKFNAFSTSVFKANGGVWDP